MSAWYYLLRNLEVVEPAPKKPEFRKITRPPKEGDYMRVIGNYYNFDNPDTYLKIYKVNYDSSGRANLVKIHSDDHPGALAKGLRSDNIHWNYNPDCVKVEFYEKV